MEHDEMYFVLNSKAIMLDEVGTPLIFDMNEDQIDWETEDFIDWMDLKPNEYQLYKAVVDFLQQYSVPMYVK